MKYKYSYMTIASIGFVLGLVMSLFFSFIAILINFDAGVWLEMIFVPISAFTDTIGDDMINIGNGVFYAIITTLFTFFIRKIKANM